MKPTFVCLSSALRIPPGIYSLGRDKEIVGEFSVIMWPKPKWFIKPMESKK